MTAWPRGALAEPDEVARRAGGLHRAHMRPLAAYVRGLRAQARGTVPDFDPEDGGPEARLLLLLEKPGSRPAGPQEAGFVSRDNDTGTARAIAAFMREAGVPRAGVVIWNTVPWWNGTTAVRAGEARAGAAELDRLLPILPHLRGAILAGRIARVHAGPRLIAAGLRVFPCVHPSPQCRAGPATSAEWARLPVLWRHAWRAVCATPKCETNRDA